jgi:hypothetical protein
MSVKELEKRLKKAEEVISKLEKKVRVHDDIEEIKQLHYHYVNSLMKTDWHEVNECFAEDAKLDVGYDPKGRNKKGTRGKQNIALAFKNNIAKWHVGQEGDFVVHPIITVDGNRAKGSWLLYMMYFFPRTGQSLYWVQGWYDMRYKRENGEWKISMMKWRENIGLPDKMGGRLTVFK